MVIRKHADIFPDDLPAGLPPEREHDHQIELEPGAQPIVLTQWRQTQPDLDELRSQQDYLLEKGFVRPSLSPFVVPILFTPRKNGGLRMCNDYRALNRVIIKSRYPIPRADKLIDQLRGAKFFSKIDQRCGYHQIRVNDADCYETAFRTRYGSCEYTVMSFGLTNVPSTFHFTMNEVFWPLLDKCVIVYLDDILVYSTTWEQHLKDLTDVSSLFFLGFVNYVCRFIPNMAGVTSPLTDLLKKGTFHEWGGEQQAAFEQLKRFLTPPSVLRIAYPHRPFELIIDASDLAVGAVLLQDFGEGLQPIAYESRNLNPAERNYPVNDKELLAIIHAFKVWRCYLTSADVTVRTDYKSLQFIRAQPTLNPQLIRWLDYLEYNFHYRVTYKRGVSNIADALTRPSIHTTA
ncbi:hypothetical protein CLOM_g20478 [Closterium sp. NIES-68]|nr:hypothetical protein CLOM_g20478 [Closterium sp. NIES-68]GJP59625.1 hypothetical protein CLOP_g13269 [Closterium sp. NIES-67]